MARSYALTAATIVASVGAGIFCLDLASLGKTYRLHGRRPGPELNRYAVRGAGKRVDWRTRSELDGARADLPSGSAHVVSPAASPLIRVDIMGPLEQRAGFHDPCSGWSDGHDAVCDRIEAALAEGDVLLVVDSPGGAAAGIEQAVGRALAAKARFGRTITAYADEMIGSAATWWTMALADAVYLPPAGMIGSIGARGEHMSVAGMMAKEGLVKTYFADPPDKVALAPEFPLGPVGEARGNRDVKIAADAFRAAICASPVGSAAGLTPEYLIDLGADMLTGEAAVDAGLATGVETLEAVTAYALRMAESASAKDIEASARARTRVAARAA